jgi:hypothetical protein
VGQKLKKLLANYKTQRLLYFFGIPLWTYLWYIDDLSEYPNKTLDIAWAIPTSMLLFQVIFNNKIMWTVLFVIFALFATGITIGSTYSFITSNKFSTDIIFEFAVFISIVTTLTWTFYNMRPKQLADTLKYSS